MTYFALPFEEKVHLRGEFFASLLVLLNEIGIFFAPLYPAVLKLGLERQKLTVKRLGELNLTVGVDRKPSWRK